MGGREGKAWLATASARREEGRIGARMARKRRAKVWREYDDGMSTS